MPENDSTPNPDLGTIDAAKAAGAIVLGALVVLYAMRRGFRGLTVQIGG